MRLLLGLVLGAALAWLAGCLLALVAGWYCAWLLSCVLGLVLGSVVVDCSEVYATSGGYNARN